MIHVTSTALNAGTLAYDCVRSVVNQTHADWHMHYLDAGSKDNTFEQAGEAAKLLPKTVKGPWRRQVTVTSEFSSTGIFDKLLPLWRSLPDEDTIVWLDGDDALATKTALATVAMTHDAGALVTYGQFMWADGSLGFASPVGPDPRAEPWRATHLKTFRAGLVKQIKDEDLRDEDGEYYKYVTDQCVMLPLLEMAPERSIFIPKILHLYNGDSNQGIGRGINGQRDRENEFRVLTRIRNQARYKRTTVGISGAV